MTQAMERYGSGQGKNFRKAQRGARISTIAAARARSHAFSMQPGTLEGTQTTRDGEQGDTFFSKFLELEPS
jgi:hypothetical protein